MIMKREYTRALPDQWFSIASVFVALGDPHRQRIVLLFDKNERLNVGQIVEVATITRSAVSHHLKILKTAGVLQSEKVGKEVYFWINKPFVEHVLQDVLDYVRENT